MHNKKDALTVHDRTMRLNENAAKTRSQSELVNSSRALNRKIAWRVVPLAVIGYIIAQIDRTNVAFAKLQFLDDLSFNDAIYGMGAGLFFAGYFLCEVPSNILLSRIGARLTFTRIMILWGALSVGMAFVTNPTQFYVMRFLLGAAEAGFFPGIILYFSYWLPNDIRGRAIAFFAMGASIAGIVGGPLSGWLMSLDGVHGLRGWQLLFIYEGIPAILLGIFCYFYVDDKPSDAKWLTKLERELLQERLAAEAPSNLAAHKSIRSAFKEPTVYLLALAYLSILAGTQAVSLWTPTLLKQLGIGITTIGLLAAIPPAAAIISIFFVGRSSDRRQERKWHFALPLLIAGASLGALGLGPMSVAGTVVLMTIVASGAWSALSVFWTIPSAFLSTNTKAAGIGFISSAGAIGGFMSPNIVGWSTAVTGTLFAGFAVIGAMLGLSAFALVICLNRRAVK
ncbi:MFS transporter [Pseudomonas abietaniphila]|uniref:MFS transporter n=1 Tax=Pseudomonas abietaniphila TaxID=89065 RepID=UPI00321690EC